MLRIKQPIHHRPAAPVAVNCLHHQQINANQAFILKKNCIFNIVNTTHDLLQSPDHLLLMNKNQQNILRILKFIIYPTAGISYKEI